MGSFIPESLSFVLPDYFKRFPRPTEHPEYSNFKEEALENTLKWVGNDEARRAVHSKGDFARFWAMFTPEEAPASRIRVAVQFHHWIFEVNDACDEGDITTPESRAMLTFFIETMKAIVMGEDVQQVVPHRWKAIHEMYKPIREDIAAESTLDFQHRFAAQLCDFLDVFIAQADPHAAKFQSIKAYCEHRSQKSCARPGCRMMEFMLGIQLPSWLLDCPQMIRIEQCCGDVMAFHNDIISYRKEYLAEQGDVKFNAVSIFMKLEGKSLQEAVDATDKIANELVREIASLEKEILAMIFDDEALTQDMTRYLDAIQRFGPADLWWSLSSRRYFPDPDQVMAARVVELPFV